MTPVLVLVVQLGVQHAVQGGVGVGGAGHALQVVDGVVHCRAVAALQRPLDLVSAAVANDADLWGNNKKNN